MALGPDRITAEDLRPRISVATAELDDGVLRARTGRATDAERLYLRAIAELGPGPVRSGEVAKVLTKSSTALGPTSDGLIKKALCYSPRYGEIDFTVPMFDAFMKRWLPVLDVLT